jgi:hypothetical protein
VRCDAIAEGTKDLVRWVGLSGLEPLTSALSGQRSNRLSYRPSCLGCARSGHKPKGYLICRDSLKSVAAK